MANAAALINEGLWRKDKDFQQLPRLAQCTFLQVLSQKDLDTAGVLTLHLDLLAKGCDELTTAQLREDFTTLEAARFVFVDYCTDELLIRSYVRLVSAKSPNAWRSVPKNAGLVASEKIRHELASELRRLRRKDADEVAAEIDPVGTPSEPHPNGVPTQSEGDNPSEPHLEPPSRVQVPVLNSLPVVGTGGEERRPKCSKHEENSDDNCRACMRRREWDESHEADDLEHKRLARAAALKAQHDCQLCDEYGWLLSEDGTPVEPPVKCTAHQLAVIHA